VATNVKPRTASSTKHNTLTLWRERMGYSPDDACDALGCSTHDWVTWEGNNNAPRYILLALGALAMGMEPYSENGKGG